MSRDGNRENSAGEPSEALEVIKEEHSPAISSVQMDNPTTPENEQPKPCTDCACVRQIIKPQKVLSPEEIETLIKEKEEQILKTFNERLEREIDAIKERADFILQNEQVRASYMLREAHRERQEKIGALQTQLECKNLAGLMYVMCTERRKSKLEQMRLIEEYTKYIFALQDILTEAQSLILNLSRGYKTAARVDEEWRQKVSKILSEFQMFVHDYAKGTPESDQFFFDLPTILKTEVAIVDNPEEDPCEIMEEECSEEEEAEVSNEKKEWYERLDGTCHPFIMFGDMAEFKPPQRREVLKTLKASRTKTAPKKWKEYVFNEMFVKRDCKNADAIKDEYPLRVPAPTHWVCQQMQPETGNASRLSSMYSRRATSVDIRGTMGSILKMISCAPQQQVNATTLLGARDSMEIASATKLNKKEKRKTKDHSKVILNIASRRTSMFNDNVHLEAEDEKAPEPELLECKQSDDDEDDSASVLGSVHKDSLTVIPSHTPDQDHKIHYERICPMEMCKRMYVDSFTKALPPYMRVNPFTQFEQTYDEYQTCSPEQLATLRQRIDRKKKKEKADLARPDSNPLLEWAASGGVATQTSGLSVRSLPPCSCRVTSPDHVPSRGLIFNMEDLIPMKEALNEINKEFFYDTTIEFDRFKVIGQDSSDTIKGQSSRHKQNRLQEIRNVLKQHPSLLDIFQANTV